jgi:hypothetical protein
MRDDPAAGHGSHVRIFEAMIAAKGRKVANGSDGLSTRIDKSFVCLYELTLANAMYVRPALV